MQVIFHRLVLAEYRKSLTRYRRIDFELGLPFEEAVLAAARRIEEDRFIGTPCFEHFYWLRLKKFKFLLYYRQITDSLIMIYAVAHGSRRQGYWLRRTK